MHTISRRKTYPILTIDMDDVNKTLKSPVHNNSHNKNPIYQTISLISLGNVDLETGDYKDGSVFNKDLFLIKNLVTKKYLLILPDKSNIFPLKSSLYLINPDNTPISDNDSWRVVLQCKDINKLINKLNVYELELFQVVEYSNLLQNIQVDDIYKNSYEVVSGTNDEELTKKFTDVWEKYIGNEASVITQKPNLMRNKNIYKIVKYFNVPNMIDKYQQYFNF